MTTSPASTVTAPKAGDTPLIELLNVTKVYTVRAGGFRGQGRQLRAVDGVSLSVPAATTLGLVGESGCGKTTLSRLLLRQEPPTTGEVRYAGKNVWSMGRGGQKDFHRQVSAVFQDPYSSLNPRHRVREIVTEPLMVNSGMSRHDREEKLQSLLSDVGLPPAAAGLYPHEFSGGQRQRIAIARAIALNPGLVVLDEPVSALDVSIRAQILNLLKELQERHQIAYVFIAHDLAAVEHMSDQMAVMYLGALVEYAPVEGLYGNPLHPYTKALLLASQPPQPGKMSLEAPLSGEVPSPLNLPSGCRFRTRCPIAEARCAELSPQLREVRPGHYVSCHLVN
ncbi:MAG: ATP-binding cassette domain-containing protein [Dehalococcoidia bacterium]|nr:ATP-binding cassette domain-containing protein [Dehalococcoidia bacterium]